MKRHYHYLNTGWYVALWVFAAAFVVWGLLFIAFSVTGRGVQTGPIQTAYAASSQTASTAQAPAREAEAEHVASLGGNAHA